jgi:Tol biopolymer transport system component
MIWIKEIASGSETPLTTGPDDFPRVSRDGEAILFTRGVGARRALFRVPAIGGEPSKIVDDVFFSGDWSPDARQVTFVRQADQGGSDIYIAGIDGSAEVLLHRFSEQRCYSARWSPDGKTIAAAINQSGRQQSVALIGVGTRQVKILPIPNPYNLLSSVAWDPDSRSLFYMQAESASANSSGSTAVLFRQNTGSGQLQRLLWSPAHCVILDLLPTGNIVLDARSSRQNLREFPMRSAGGPPRSLTLGSSTDRQPAYSPDNDQIVFSSNRSGNLELWSVSRKSGVLRRLTDHPADDWDPAFSPDGRHLIWTANRTGNFEVWMANADGSAPRQVTHDGFVAHNPTMTRDAQWIVFAAYNPQKAGIWKIHPDGTGETALIRSATVANADVSPDGKYAAYRDVTDTSFVAIKVLEVDSGALVPFEIHVSVVKETPARVGRVRWMPDSRALVFLGQNEAGVNGIYIQDFMPGKDTANTRRPFGPFDPENSAESFGISPDGQLITISTWEQSFNLMVTDGLINK